MSLDFEFSPIDVALEGHPKAYDAGPEAMGLWLWGKLHSKHQRTGGRLRRSAVLAAWGGKRNIALAKRLVTAGLWIARDDGDWDIFNEEKKSPGRQSSSAERMRRLRDKRKGDAPGDGCDASHVTASDVTHVTGDVTPPESVTRHMVTSCSLSVSSSSGSLDLVEADPDLPDRSSMRAREDVPPWFVEAAKTAAFAVGDVGELPARWLEYQASRERKGWGQNHGDAAAWLTSVVRRERRDAKPLARGGGPRGDRQPHDQAWLDRAIASGTTGDL